MRNSQKRFVILFGTIWLVLFLIIGAGLFYLAPSTWPQGWFLLMGGLVLVGILASWIATRAFKRSVFQSMQQLQENATDLRDANEHLRLELDERLQIEAGIKARARQQAAVAELGQRALVGTDLTILMDEAAFAVTQTLGVEYCQVFELITENNTLLLRAGSGWQQELIGHFTIEAKPDTQAGYTLHSKRPIIVKDFRTETRFSEASPLPEHQLISGLSVVIQGRSRPFGVLGVHSARPREFTEDDIHFLQAMANVLAMAIERKQTETQIMQRNRQLLTLQSAGIAIASNLDLQYVLNTVTREMTNLLNVEACTLSTWDQKSDTVSLLARHSPDDWSNWSVSDEILPLKDYPLAKRALMERTALQITTDQPDLSPVEQNYLQTIQAKTLLMLPMIFQERVVGLVEILDRAKQTFSEQETALAQLLANQAASAIENARLYTETRNILREQIVLREAGTVISSTLDLETVLNHIAEQMGRYAKVTSAYICTFDPAHKSSTVLAKYIGGDASRAEQMPDLGAIYNLEKDFTDSLRFLQANQPEVIHADDPDLAEAEYAYLQQFQAKTLLTIPMQIGGQTIAYAWLWESRQKREFMPEEITQCRDIAQQAAIAVENARLFEQTQTALNETEALYRVAHALAQMDDEQEMFEFVLTSFLKQLKLRQGSILIIAEDKTYGTTQALVRDGQLIDSVPQIPVAGNPLAGKLLATKEPLVINDAQNDTLLEQVNNLTAEREIKSLLMVPIMARGDVIGILGCEATETRHDFTDREISLAKAMANQLGIAIENKHLHAETEHRTLQLTVLNELDRAVTSSLHLNDIYHAFAHHAARLLTHSWMSIALTEEDYIRIAYVINENEDKSILPPGTTLPRQGSAVDWVVTQRQPLVRHNIEADIRYAEDEQLVKLGIQSVMLIPLRVKGQVIGTWNIGRRQVGAFTPDDMETAQSMADQLAVTIENARLYNEIHQYLDELHTLNMISQTINSTLDLQRILILITENTMRLLKVEAASVVLHDELHGNLWFAATSGGGADLVQGMQLERGQGIVGWVIEQGEPALVPDVSQDTRFFNQIDQYSNFTTRSILCVPLQTKGQTIGAVEAINKESGAFNQEDLRLLTSLVAPAATAIENARLFEQAQQEIADRQRAETALEKERALLARRVAERTADLSAANAELARAARLKDEFLASMSHELRTPLTAILGLADVLKLQVYGSLTEKQLKSVRGIEESGRHLLDLINDILDLSKIEAGKLELEIGPVSAQSVCQASLQFIMQSANKKQLKIFSTYDETVTTLVADERRLKQILVNLLSNAVKFTPEGGRIGLEVLGDSHRHIVDFVVWDTGIGIAPEHINHLFQPFVQLDSRLARQYTGTGLGLALVRRMVEMHGGSISVESEVDKGSRFTVSLPLHGLAQVEEETDESDYSMPDISAISRALIIEDSPTVTNQLTHYLERLGLEVATHSKGTDAIEKVFEVKPDVIILDVLLPGSSGWEILAQLKAEPQTEQIPVLIVSVIDEPEQGLALGAAEFLVKPITQQQLYEALRRIASTRAESVELWQPTIEPGQETALADTVATGDSPLILLAEDQDNISKFVADYLVDKKGYRVIVSRNGLEALERARAEKPDLILMDIQMPEMDGLEATRQLRADADLADVPIVALTALAMPGDRERCLEAGADAYLSKPIDLKELAKMIAARLGKTGRK